MKKIILASASPRRSDILKQLGIEFNVLVPECDENIQYQEPADYVMKLSERKCKAAAQIVRSEAGLSDGIVIGADTIVAYSGNIFGKPKNSEDALRMLKELSGKTHSVYTGVTVIDVVRNITETFFEETEVEFYDIPDSELEEYVNTGEPLDKAGAYGIQGRGCFLVKKINGDYLNVVGLPGAHLMRVLKGINNE